MAVIVNGDGILTGISSLATALTDLTSGRGTVTGVATVGTLQLGAGVSISSPRTQNAAIFTNNSEFLTVDDAGRVGVGTVTPNSDAHPQNVGKINVGFITARSIAGDIDANTMVVAGVGTFTDDVTFTGATRAITFDKSDDALEFGDEMKATFGNSGDLVISHSGTASQIQEVGTGSLHISTNGTQITIDKGATESMANFKTDGAVELFYDNSLKFATSSSGVSVTGNIDLPDNTSGNASLRLGNSQDFFMNHNGSDSYIINNTGNLYVRDLNGNVHIQGKDNEEGIIVKADAEVELYYNNALKFETLTSGVEVQGSVIAKNTGAGSGSSNLELQPYGTDAYINATASGNLYTRVGPSYPIRTQIDSSGNFIVQNGNIKLATSGKGIDFSVTGQAASPSSEVLDDYEEGTWTFAIVPGGGSYQYNYGQTGYYSKIGNQVFINAWIHLIVSSTVSGGITLTGLPFPCQNRSRNWIPVGGYGHSSAINSAGLFLIATTNGTTGSFYYTNTAYGAGASLTAGNLGSSAELYINGTYLTDS